jgi:hypothetical protein
VRQKLFIALAAGLCLLALLVELGADSILPAQVPSEAEVGATLSKGKAGADADIDVDELAKKQPPTPPGLAIRYLALYDGLLFASLGLMALGGLLAAVPKTHIRIQNITLLVASLIDVILSFILALLALAALLGMVALFLAAPFGTIAYLVGFGFFAVGRATTILSLVMVLKIAMVVLVILGGQLNRRLLVRLGVSLALGLLVSFLQAFPPTFLVSILDALAAIVVAIIALIMAIPVLLGSIVGVVKALRA